MPPFFRGMRAAFVFLTRVPLGGYPYSERDWVWSAAHFPFVGLALGVPLGLLDRALLPIGPLGAAFLTLGIAMLLTGAFHEDGLADTSDALGGAYDREKLVTILKDSRIGSFGGAALVFSIGARAALIAELGRAALWGIPVVWCAARVAPVVQMAILPYATTEGAKSRLVAQGHWAQAWVAIAWVALVVLGCVALRRITVARGGALGLALAFVVAVTTWRYKRRLGGTAGDFLGATEQLCEIAGFAVLAWSAS